MSKPEGKHVFVSYVHENDVEVDQLCAVLEAAHIPYWRDRKSLGPGDAWKAKIRQAIRGGSLVFLACFSDKSRTKNLSHMNEELTIAVEEYRKMPPGRTWLIPVRFDSGDVPNWDLGAGRSLSDLNYSDLFGPGHAAQAASLVTTIHGVMGSKQMGTAAVLEAVEQATSADRADLLKRMTKEMLLDSARRIELDDLISQEVQRIVAACGNVATRVSAGGETADQQVLRWVEQAHALSELTLPFCATLQVAARYGSPETLAPWASALRVLVQAGHKTQGGETRLLELRHLPGMVSLVTAGMACVTSQRWDNLRVLVAEGTVRHHYDGSATPLLEATNPYKPFDYDGWTSNTLAWSSRSGKSFEDALRDISSRRKTKFHTPVAEWLHDNLRSIFKDQIPDDDTYDADFDRAEVVLGVLAQDAVNARSAISSAVGLHGSNWYGRSTWRVSSFHGNPVEDLQIELANNKERWAPLRAELFGGQVSRAEAALKEYADTFRQLAQQRY